jgi:hypothetical protein
MQLWYSNTLDSVKNKMVTAENNKKILTQMQRKPINISA